MTKKQIAISFLNMAATGNVRAAYEYTSHEFIHHNQYFKGDRESLMLAMEEAHKVSPNKFIDIKHVYEDGNTVITHSLVVRSDPTLQEIAVVHIFLIENEKILELWDFGQIIEKNSPNENGLF